MDVKDVSVVVIGFLIIIIGVVLAFMLIADTRVVQPKETAKAVSGEQTVSQSKLSGNVVSEHKKVYYVVTKTVKTKKPEPKNIIMENYRHRYYDGWDSIYNYRDRKKRVELTVRVKDRRTEERIEDAKVRLTNGERETEFTDSDGEAEFEWLKKGCYDIDVYASGYKDKSEDVCLKDGDKRLTVYLRKR